MNRNQLISLVLLVALLTITFSGVVSAESSSAAERALDWLKTQQNDDGGFGSGFAPGSAVGPTTDAIIAITSGGFDVSTWTNGGASPLDYLRTQVNSDAVTLPGEVAKTILAVIATGQNPRGFGNHDLIADLNSNFDASSATYSFSTFDQSLAILALRNAAEPIPDAAIEALLNAQTIEGGWAFTGDTSAGAADSNTTSLGIQALVSAAHKDATGRALDYLRRVQNLDSGWTYQVPSAFGTDTDVNSTALTIQAILAVGDSVSDWAVGGSDPVGALLALQNDDGSFSFQSTFPGPNILATLQAIPALYGNTLVSVNVVRAADTNAAEVVLLPEAGGASNFIMIGTVGLALIMAGYLLRRRVQVS